MGAFMRSGWSLIGVSALSAVACSSGEPGSPRESGVTGPALSSEDARAVRRRLRAAPAAATSAMPTGEGTRGQASLLPSPIAPMPDRSGRFVMRRPGSSTFFTQRGFAWSLSAPATTEPRDPRSPREQARKGWGVHCTLVGARDGALAAEQASAGRVHHFVGASSAWATDQPTYGRLVWEELYPGIDLVTEPAPRGISYRFVLSPGAKIADVRMHWEGATAVRVVDEGRGVDVETGLGVLRVRGLRAFAIDGSADRRDGALRGAALRVGGRRGRRRGRGLGWAGAARDRSDGRVGRRTSGARRPRAGAASRSTPVATPSSWAALVRPTSRPAVASTRRSGGYDAFVTKVDGSGALVWSSYLGGASSDSGFAIAVDGRGGNAVRHRRQRHPSTDFPSGGGFDTSRGSVDAFVTKVSGSGALLWSSYLGGAGGDERPWHRGRRQRQRVRHGQHAVERLPDRRRLRHDPRRHAGRVRDEGERLGRAALVVVPRRRSATRSRQWHRGRQGRQRVRHGAARTRPTSRAGAGSTRRSAGRRYDDAFVTKVSGSGALLWSSYLGGGAIDYGNGIAVDGGGNAFVTGFTRRPTSRAAAASTRHVGGAG